MDIKLVSYNIKHGWKLDEVIEYLKQENADVIQIQEIGTMGQNMKPSNMNMYEKVKESLGYYGGYSQMFRIRNDEGVWDMGVATYTKWPIVESWGKVFDVDEVEECMDREDKSWKYEISHSVLGLNIDFRGRRLWLINAHAPVTPDARETKKQLEAVVNLKKILNTYDEFVFTGDMNMLPSFEAYRVLSEGLVDVSNHSIATLHPTNHAVGNLNYHVDYVFLKGSNLSCEDYQVPLVDGSDHLPTVCRIRI